MPLVSALFGSGDTSRATDLGLLILRVLSGLALAVAHGIGKLPPSDGFVGAVGRLGFPAPEVFAWVAGLAEFGGGVLLAFGLLTRPAALAVAATMAVALFGAHGDDPFADGEKAFLFLTAALALLATGAGRYSLDRLIYRRRATYS